MKNARFNSVRDVCKYLACQYSISIDIVRETVTSGQSLLGIGTCIDFGLNKNGKSLSIHEGFFSTTKSFTYAVTSRQFQYQLIRQNIHSVQ